jgi:SAM-dependent methyltransferase
VILTELDKANADGLFRFLEQANQRPRPFEFYTASDLWTDKYVSQQMLAYHLNPEVDAASRNLPFIERSVAWIAQRFNAAAGCRIADFGCGPGLYASRLAQAGACVTGIDFSARSLDYARQQAAAAGLGIEYMQQNYLEFDSPARFDLIIMIMCDFCALSPEQRAKLLSVFARHLVPGGAVLLDVYSPVAFAARTEEARYELNLLHGFWSANPYYGFLNVFKYEAEQVVLDKYAIVEPGRVRVIYNWLQHFTPAALVAEFASAGFAVAETLSNVAGGPYDAAASEFAVIARKW